MDVGFEVGQKVVYVGAKHALSTSEVYTVRCYNQLDGSKIGLVEVGGFYPAECFKRRHEFVRNYLKNWDTLSRWDRFKYRHRKRLGMAPDLFVHHGEYVIKGWFVPTQPNPDFFEWANFYAPEDRTEGHL